MEKKASVCLVIILAFLVPSNAIPLSRVQRLLPMQEASVEEITPKPEVVEIRSSITPQDDTVMNNARMTLETQDYPPSGPNKHHKPPGWS